MKSAAKWLVAGGAFLLIGGFFLPVVTFSLQGSDKSISLLQIASFPYWFFLYLVPLAALGTLALAFVPSNDRLKIWLQVGQIAGLGIGFFILLVTLVYFLLQPEQLRNPSGLGGFLPPNFLTSELYALPAIGSFAILAGFGLAAFGILTDFFPTLKNLSKPPQQAQAEVLGPEPKPLPEKEARPAVKEAHLEVTKGKLAGKTYKLHEDGFSIGRGRENDMQLSDASISRKHARLRYAEGNWFIQDQNSKTGIFVNGKKVQAIRLNSGDHIKIGENTFIFRV